MKKLVISTLFVLQAFLAFAQQPTGITGRVVDAKTQKPLQNVVASILNTNFTQLTDARGVFLFTEVAKGSQLLQIKSVGYKDQMLPVEIFTGQMIDLGVLALEEDQSSEQQLSLITITENDLGDDNSGSESTSGLLQASRDSFQQAAAFNWGQARFRIRGLDNEYGTTMINGVTMNKIYDGRPQWSNWGGLNDATRNQEFTMGSSPSDYTFGGILGTQEINTRASIYRPGSRISFSGTNTNYNWRVMGTHASGMNKDGWAFVISAGRRWAKEAYFEGTDYSANSLFASVEKKINDHHSLNFTSIYAQNSRGKSSPNTDEVTRIAGVKYNSYWGWQDGKKRNSRDKDVEEPILMLGHYWKINDKTNLNTNVMYQTGQIGNSRIDYQGARNPDPTYYGNLPSYYTSRYNIDDYSDWQGDTPENIALANDAKFLTNRQLDWDFLYKTNSETHDGNSVYILYEDRTDDKLWTANTVLNSQLADNITMNGGATFKKLKSHNFQNLLDLLGGKYFEDYDNFQDGSEQQSDLNFPKRNVVEGDTFGYNYNLLATTFDAFTQFKFTYKKADFYLAQTFARNEYQREGLYKNGIYPTNSFGKGDKHIYENFGFKGGLTYKLTGRHLLTFNGAYMTKAPALRNVFPNARLNNNALELDSENVTSLDASYIVRAPKLKTRLTAYYSNVKHATETSFFFGEGIFDDETSDGGDAFVAETVTNIEKQNIGAELGIEYQLTTTIKLTANAAYGEHTYNNNPNVSLNNDNLASPTNTNPVVDFGTAKLKGYRQSGGPQTAASFGIEYRDPHFWWIGANGNYLADNYMDVSALLRTDNFFKNPMDANGDPFPEATQERASELLKQQKFDEFYLVNLTGGKSWKVGNQTFGIFASINNVLDTKYKTGGFEQARNANFRELNQDVSSGTPAFGPKYFYGNGRTYFVNLYINF
ncbi:carboxypeptidase-like regulatory domain-containing protein [Flavobacterium humi]|uniref:TonB-dependent receptor n=1 Tax=Flavobacterium humi TaxID=2562683 RepID=A0A4Z0L810_9FLAO|nr:carboxypeptidase-like regulatory domain-containing protein [Flavobacterium humi]TGD58554.1 TonB-dependent receptor [Flavobacterium humi]